MATLVTYHAQIELLNLLQLTLAKNFSTLEEQNKDLAHKLTALSLTAPDLSLQAALTELFQQAPFCLFELLKFSQLADFKLATFWQETKKMPPLLFTAKLLGLPEDAGSSSTVLYQAVQTKTKINNLLLVNYILTHSSAVCQQLAQWSQALSAVVTSAELKQYEAGQEKMTTMLQQRLTATPPLLLSQELLGKNFYHKGPYENFAFLPLAYLPVSALRIFQKDQFLFLASQQQNTDLESLATSFKVLGDATRFKLLTYLSIHQHSRAVDLANALALTPATVSHHLEVLRRQGFLHEEPNGREKIFSLNLLKFQQLLQSLEHFTRK